MPAPWSHAQTHPPDAELPRLLPWLFAIGILANLAPIWAVTWVPMGDVFGHVQLMDIVLRYHSEETVYASLYTLPRSLDPNTLSLWFARLVPGLNALTAVRVLLSLYVIFLPLSLAWLARTWHRSPWLALLALPLTWNALVNIGFLNYLIAWPVLFATLVLARQTAEAGGWRRGLALAVALCVLFFSHVIAFLIGAGMVVFVLLWHGEGRARWLRLWPVLLASPVAGQWVWRKFVALEATPEGRTFGTHSGDLALWVLPPRQLVAQLYEWSLRYFRDGVDMRMAVLALGLWLALVCLGLSPRLRGAVAVAWRDRSLELMTVICAGAYFVLPSHMNEMSIITERIIMQVLFLLALWPQVRFTAWRRWLLVPMLLLGVGYAAVVRAEFRRFEQQEIGSLPEALRRLPLKSRFCFILVERDSELTYMNTVWHIPRAVFSVAHGGAVDDSFAVRPYTPVQYKPGKIPVSLTGAFWTNPHLFDYDYVLVRQAVAPLAPDQSPYVQLVWQEGHYWLYRVKPGDRASLHQVVVGGGGGTGQFADCPRGQVLHGLTVQHKDGIVRSLVPMCTPLTGRGAQADSPSPAGRPPSARLGPRAVNGEDVRLTCPMDTFVIGMSGRAAAYVDALGLQCAPVPWNAHSTRLSSTRTVGGDGGEPFQRRCPEGEVAVGVQGSFGEVADQAGLACADWSRW